MTVLGDFNHIFSEANLKQIYEKNILLSKAKGIDNLNHRAFRPTLSDQVEIISRKVNSSTYNFTKYKLKLISKGRGEIPREISIPTIRDRVALRGVCDFLALRFNSALNFDLPQTIVRSAKHSIESCAYNSFVKLDVQNFYPTIKHEELLKRLRKRIRPPHILSLIEKAVQTPTVSRSVPSDQPNTVGIPQGLSISNILSAIYLINIDRAFSVLGNVEYFRYVDDVLILCDHTESSDIANSFIKRCGKIGLKIHDPKVKNGKSRIGRIGVPFSYLGYHFEGSMLSVREGSVRKFRDSVANIFTSYRYSKTKNINFLIWRLNLRVTGCVFQNKCKGWLFFFSEINDEKILHQLDHYIRQIKKRFGVTDKSKKLVGRSRSAANRTQGILPENQINIVTSIFLEIKVTIQSSSG